MGLPPPAPFSKARQAALTTVSHHGGTLWWMVELLTDPSTLAAQAAALPPSRGHSPRGGAGRAGPGRPQTCEQRHVVMRVSGRHKAVVQEEVVVGALACGAVGQETGAAGWRLRTERALAG